MTDHLIFEETYYSNDGRLRLGAVEDGVHVVKLDGFEVFATRDRAKADAYIAGYDLAESVYREI